jgi:hypothetical protein
MELMLPSSGSATGWLRLERGDLAGRRYGVEISICPSPVCQCERVRLRCFPETTEQSPQASVPVCLEMDLEQSAIANFQQLKSDPVSIIVAKARGVRL